MDVYNDKWNFENVDIVFIDCVHDYEHVKSDIDNSINNFEKPLFVFDDYGLFPEVKKAIDEYISKGIFEVKTFLGNPTGTEFPKTLNVTLKDWEGIVCQTM